MDNAILALSCGMTRVVTLQWSHTVSPTAFRWINVQEGHHDLSHKDDADMAGVANFVATERWYAEQFAYFINQLKSTLRVQARSSTTPLSSGQRSSGTAGSTTGSTSPSSSQGRAAA